MRMDRILLATTNRGKIKELKDEFRDLDIELLTLSDFSFILPYLEDPEETGSTFEENALIKAAYYYDKFKMPVLSDDSGLMVDALNGVPGVYSGRYSGVTGLYKDVANMDKLSDEMRAKNISESSAKYVCSMILYLSNRVYISTTGICNGIVKLERRGSNGFGYDPMFWITNPEGGMRTMAELNKDEKNEISHRGKALRNIKKILKKFK